MNIEEILTKMTLEEKAKLVSGKDFWATQNYDNLGIPSIMMTDGPHGLRKQVSDNSSLNTTTAVPATAFPSASTTSCSFDKEVLYKMGHAIGEECVKEDVSLLLGPGVNIKRSPICGRNFEYFSEDPLLSGKLSAGFTNGIQSLHVGACLKHFACNNQETARQVLDSIVDERALNEIYLKGYKIAIEESNPYSIMCSYNKVNGTYCSENMYTLRKKLRDEFHYDGVVVTDWGATDDRVDGLKASLDLEMPGSGTNNTTKIIKAIKKGKLDIKYLDDSVRRILSLIEKSKNEIKDCDLDKHHDICAEIAEDSIVLLKNDDNFFPLNKEDKDVLMVGNFFNSIRFMGGGSSQMIPYKVTNVNDALDQRKIPYQFALGYDLKEPKNNEVLLKEAVNKAKNASKVILFIGLTDKEEAEGYDRPDINLPEEHNKLVEEILKVNPNLGIVLFNGSVVYMPWKDKVKAIFKAGLPGENGGTAIANLLYGDTNPSARLSETYINDLKINPSYLNYGDHRIVYYKESNYVGYRYYGMNDIPVAYPFGYGLSYTTFKYSNLNISLEKDVIDVSFDIKNTGNRPGKEAIQIYFSAPSSKIARPERELMEIDKVFLDVNETKTLSYKIKVKDLSYFNVYTKKFEIENGLYKIIIGQDAITSILEKSLEIKLIEGVAVPEIYKNYLTYKDNQLDISDKAFSELLRHDLPVLLTPKKRIYSINSTFSEIQEKWLGRLVYNTIMKEVNRLLGAIYAEELSKMFEDMPIRCLSMFTNGKMGYTKIEGLADMLNNHFFRGLKKMMSK